MSRRSRNARSDFRVWRRYSTRWSDNDAYGHVNNVIYYQWFDSAVNAWLVEQGLLDISRGQHIAIVAETRCSYAAPLSFPCDVEVGLAASSIGTSSIVYRIGIFRPGSEQAAAQGEFVHVLVDRETRRPIALPGQWRRSLEAIA